jgi:hypothetical protein
MVDPCNLIADLDIVFQFVPKILKTIYLAPSFVDALIALLNGEALIFYDFG